jgi:hypothetical protein
MYAFPSKVKETDPFGTFTIVADVYIFLLPLLSLSAVSKRQPSF